MTPMEVVDENDLSGKPLNPMAEGVVHYILPYHDATMRQTTWL